MLGRCAAERQPSWDRIRAFLVLQNTAAHAWHRGFAEMDCSWYTPEENQWGWFIFNVSEEGCFPDSHSSSSTERPGLWSSAPPRVSHAFRVP